MILQFPDSKLYTLSEVITVFDKELHKLAYEMLKITIEEKAVGLAAIQIGINKRIFVMLGRTKKYIFVNPEILSSSDIQIGSEGCLSSRGKYIDKQRPLNVVLSYQDLFGRKQKKAFSGLLARCVFHEIDHLNGLDPLDD